jgi:hypothetical protein
MRKSEKFRIVLLIVLSILINTLILSSCSTIKCTTKAVNYNTVNR